MAQIDDKPRPAKKVIQGNSFDDGSFVNMQDQSLDNQEQNTRILSSNQNQSRMSSNSAHSSSQRDLFDSVGVSDTKKAHDMINNRAKDQKNQSMLVESQRKSFAESPKHMGLNLLEKDKLSDLKEYESKEKLLVMA